MNKYGSVSNMEVAAEIIIAFSRNCTEIREVSVPLKKSLSQKIEKGVELRKYGIAIYCGGIASKY